MIGTAYRASLLALHQLTVALGIVLLPVAVLARRAGVRLPIRRPIEATTEALEDAMSR